MGRIPKELQMISRFALVRAFTILCLSLAVVFPISAEGQSSNPNKGLTAEAAKDLRDAGVDKYLGQFSPVASEDVGNGWTKHTFDPDGGDGPICIAGTPYTAFTRAGNPAKVLIFLNGGGACWEGFPSCTPFANEDPPSATGIFADSFDNGTEVVSNKFADWSVVYLSYCDGSVFIGDNVVVDPDYPLAFLSGGVRHHRGLRNASAGIDLARATFPNASRILLAGSSAGGAGVAALAPFLVRFNYGNLVKLSVFNDAGPVAISLAPVDAIAARAADWQFGQFYPDSCVECDPLGQATAIIDWRLENDRTVREAFYSTDGDVVDRGFLSANVPGFFDPLPPIIPFPDGLTQVQYRDLILTEHGLLNEEYPDRYKRFIRSGDDAHTALRGDLFYLGEIDGVPLNEWTDDFVIPRPFWVDLVEDFIPLP
jgi:hypothetical protein